MERQEEKTLNLATLVFPVRDDNVMLAEKMRKIGKGCLNGWGGGVDHGESIRACAVREFSEETGGAIIDEQDLKKLGIVHFKNHLANGSEFICTVHVYSVAKWDGQIISTEEMKDPRWFPITTVASQKLMSADPFWLPRMLSGEKGIAFAEYEPYQKALIGSVRFESVDSFDEE